MPVPPEIVAPFAFLLFFPLLWCGICWLLAQLGGWSRLAARYASHRTPGGQPLRWQSGSVGWVNYRNVLQLDVAHDGIHLGMPWLFRVGHAPLFLPWSELHGAREQRIFWHRQVCVDVGLPRLARLCLPARAFEINDAGRRRLAAR